MGKDEGASGSKVGCKAAREMGKAKPPLPPFSFTYAEAEQFGLSTKQFARAIRELVVFGFLDVQHKGSGKHKDYSMYAWSERWVGFAATPSSMFPS